MNPGDLVRMWVDNKRIGSGFRAVLVLERRAKWATVYYEPLAYRFDVETRDLDHGKRLDFKPRRYRARAKANAKMRSRFGFGISKAGLDKALELTK